MGPKEQYETRQDGGAIDSNSSRMGSEQADHQQEPRNLEEGYEARANSPA